MLKIEYSKLKLKDSQENVGKQREELAQKSDQRRGKVLRGRNPQKRGAQVVQ